tara:strand:+ start:801 stop:1925 length:1125 start_codon:yes stop_codon:yes gene_type:complete
MATPDQEAYEQFTKALRQGQAGLDALPEDVKKKAKREAERSLEKEDRFSSYEPIPGMTPTGYEGPEDSFETKPMSELKKDRSEYEGYDPIPGIAPPKEPGPSKEFMGREEYKGFRAPAGMSDEQMKAWKEGVDDRLLEKEDRLRERIESASPQDQVKDLIRRATEGDMEAIKDIGYFGLNVGSMVGPQQAAADLGVAAMDAAEGDYSGAAVSVAAAALPVVSSGMLKAAIKNVEATKLIDMIPTDKQRMDHYDYIGLLGISGVDDTLKGMSDDAIAKAYSEILNGEKIIKRSSKDPENIYKNDALAKSKAIKEQLLFEMRKRASGSSEKAKKFTSVISGGRMGGGREGVELRKRLVESYDKEFDKLTSSDKANR